MTQNNQQKVAIVTGGSLGIGQAVVAKFTTQNYRVFNLDITPPNDNAKGVATWIECDVTKPEQMSHEIQLIADSVGQIDALICSAGVHYSANIEDTSEEDLQRVFDINVKGCFNSIKNVLPTMKKRSSGAIVIMSSDQAMVAKRNSFAYNLSKAALASMAKTTALDFAEYGIRANAVCPGTIETPLYHNAINRYVAKSGADIDQVHAEEAALQPLGRVGKAEEVAALAYFLCSEEAAFITGSLQVIDGGYTAQ